MSPHPPWSSPLLPASTELIEALTFAVIVGVAPASVIVPAGNGVVAGARRVEKDSAGCDRRSHGDRALPPRYCISEDGRIDTRVVPDAVDAAVAPIAIRSAPGPGAILGIGWICSAGIHVREAASAEAATAKAVMARPNFAAPRLARRLLKGCLWNADEFIGIMFSGGEGYFR